MYNILSILLIAGQVAFTLGCQYDSMYTMLLGRIIFGFGGESLNITQNTMLIKWFYNSEISLPLGVALSIARIGNVVNDILSPVISSVKNKKLYLVEIRHYGSIMGWYWCLFIFLRRDFDFEPFRWERGCCWWIRRGLWRRWRYRPVVF